MSCATFLNVDIIDGNLIYWFLFEGVEPNTGYHFDSCSYGIHVDAQHKIGDIYNPGMNSLLPIDSDQYFAILHAIGNDQTPITLQVEMIKLGVGYLNGIIDGSMKPCIISASIFNRLCWHHLPEIIVKNQIIIKQLG